MKTRPSRGRDATPLLPFSSVGNWTLYFIFLIPPLILGFVLGDAMERAFRQSLMMSQGDLTIFISRPISATLLIIAGVLLCLPAIRWVRAWRVEAVEREG